VAIPEQAALDVLTTPVPPVFCSTDQDIQSEVANLESGPSVIIDLFPHGSPSVPISQDSCMDGTDHKASNGLIWAPFGSQCNWEVAHWAKMQGPTLSAMVDLLVIPEVRLIFFSLDSLLMCNWRLFQGSDYLTA
jgi:hypothetical protein